ncbi:hypothetical protein AX14_008691 [Amanita brunnescens Koide BX004]|nr:hypothetical protein AX14_008691 [Amanita brunnescens Koide BX004]
MTIPESKSFARPLLLRRRKTHLNDTINALLHGLPRAKKLERNQAINVRNENRAIGRAYRVESPDHFAEGQRYSSDESYDPVPPPNKPVDFWLRPGSERYFQNALSPSWATMSRFETQSSKRPSAAVAKKKWRSSLWTSSLAASATSYMRFMHAMSTCLSLSFHKR